MPAKASTDFYAVVTKENEIERDEEGRPAIFSTRSQASRFMATHRSEEYTYVAEAKICEIVEMNYGRGSTSRSRKSRRDLW